MITIQKWLEKSDVDDHTMKNPIKINTFQKKFIFFLTACILILFIFKTILMEDNIDLVNFGISSDFIEKFRLNSISETFDSTVLTGGYGDLFIKVNVFKNTSQEKANIYISDKIVLISSLFREISSPYPGALSNRIKCLEEFKPLRISNYPLDYYIIYASSRFTYGVCSFDLIKYRSILYFQYCGKQKSLYQVKLFIPIDQDISA